MAQRRFIFVVEGDVFMQLLFDDEITGERGASWAAGLNSNPTVIEVTNDPQVVPGWTWDGSNFIPPQQ
jgi:hypothetical protein